MFTVGSVAKRSSSDIAAENEHYSKGLVFVNFFLYLNNKYKKPENFFGQNAIQVIDIKKDW